MSKRAKIEEFDLLSKTTAADKSVSDEDVYTRVVYNIAESAQYFDDAQVAGLRNAEYTLGMQWTEEEINAHTMQNRIPYVFNEIAPKINHLMGAQLSTRMDTRVTPREPADSMISQILTYVIKWVEQANDFEYTESEVFYDALVKGFGAIQIRWETTDVQFGYPVLEKIPFNELVWDLGSRKRDLSDARWIARVMETTVLEAEELFPDSSDDIRTYASNYLYTGQDSTTNIPRNKNIKQMYQSWNPSEADNQRVRIIEYYERHKRYEYVVQDDISGTTKRFDKKTEAQDYLDGLIAGYYASGLADFLERQADGSDSCYIYTLSRDLITQTILCGNVVIYSGIVELPTFPYLVNFSNFDDGHFQAFVEYLISPQILINRSLSQWDYSLGSSQKQMMTVVPAMLHRGFDVEALREERSKTAPIIPVASHAAIQSIPNQPVQPELFQSINHSMGRMEDYAGGRNALGLSEGADESGRAVIARAQAGGQGRLPYFDNLRFWRRKVAELLVWYIKNYMSAQQIIRILGSQEDVQYTKIDIGVLNSLRDLDYDIIIDEVNKTDSVREMQFQQFAELAKSVQIPQELLMPTLIELSNLPEGKKKEIIEANEFYMKYMQEKAQQQKQSQLEEQAQDMLERKKLRTKIEMENGGEDMYAPAKKAEEQKQTISNPIRDDALALQEYLARYEISPEEKQGMVEKLRNSKEISDAVANEVLGNLKVSQL